MNNAATDEENEENEPVEVANDAEEVPHLYIQLLFTNNAVYVVLLPVERLPRSSSGRNKIAVITRSAKQNSLTNISRRLRSMWRQWKASGWRYSTFWYILLTRYIRCSQWDLTPVIAKPVTVNNPLVKLAERLGIDNGEWCMLHQLGVYKRYHRSTRGQAELNEHPY